EEAESLHYGLLFFNDGRFHVDDVKFEVKNEAGEWETIPIDNAGFEAGDELPGWSFRAEDMDSFTQQAATGDAAEGDQHLLVEGLRPFRANPFFETGNQFL
ncbi:hypothetical protein RZS08_59310, partial [Arthrospira platensis SPKY1]|nr:hypothetical protein [Arthrospira platensis SPKY1]